MPSKLPWERLRQAIDAGAAAISGGEEPLNPTELADISKKLGPAAYGKITKARAGFAPPPLGLNKPQLTQADRYLEGSTRRDGSLVDKGLGLAQAAGYETLKGAAQHLPGGIPLWNSTIGRFADFKMDHTTSPASFGNITAYTAGVMSPDPREEESRSAENLLNAYRR